MELERTFKISSNVTARALGQEVVILDLASGTYFGLDPVGARVWELLAGGKTLAEIYERMVDEFDVSREMLESDVLKFIDSLQQRQLIV